MKNKTGKGGKADKGENKEDKAKKLKEEKEEKEKEEKLKKEKEEQEKQLKLLKKIRYPFNFIYRREVYEIPNQRYNTSLKNVNLAISQKLSIPSTDFTVSFKNKVISDLTTNIYDLIKNEKPDQKYFNVKKKINIDKFTALPSLYSGDTFSYGVIIGNIPSAKDLNDQINEFFEANQSEEPYSKEPVGINKYIIKFKSSDVAFNFRKFWLYLKRNFPLFQDVTIELKFPQSTKANLVRYKRNVSEIRKSHHVVGSCSNSLKVSKIKDTEAATSSFAYTPFITLEDVKKKEEMESKKRWITEKGFI